MNRIKTCRKTIGDKSMDKLYWIAVCANKNNMSIETRLSVWIYWIGGQDTGYHYELHRIREIPKSLCEEMYQNLNARQWNKMNFATCPSLRNDAKANLRGDMKKRMHKGQRCYRVVLSNSIVQLL